MKRFLVGGLLVTIPVAYYQYNSYRIQLEIDEADEILDFWFGKVNSYKDVIPQEKMRTWYRGGKEVDELITNKYSEKI